MKSYQLKKEIKMGLFYKLRGINEESVRTIMENFFEELIEKDIIDNYLIHEIKIAEDGEPYYEVFTAVEKTLYGSGVSYPGDMVDSPSGEETYDMDEDDIMDSLKKFKTSEYLYFLTDNELELIDSNVSITEDMIP